MKIINILILTLFICVIQSNAYSEEKKYDCSNIETGTVVSVAKKIWCKKNNKELFPELPKLSLKEKLKKLNPLNLLKEKKTN